MSLGPEVTSRQPRSQATPLAEDFLNLLRREIAGGTFGEGLPGLGRESGTAIRQFIENRASPENFARLAAPLTDISRRETDRSAADLREGFSIAGSRFGTPMAMGEARLRSDAGQNLDATLSNLFQSEQGNLLSGIGMMNQIGMQGIMPFLQMAMQGIMPEQTMIQENPFMTLLGGLGGLGMGAGTAAQGFSNL